MDLLAALLCAKVSVFPFMHCWQCLLETPHDRSIQSLHFSSSLLHLLRNRLYLGGLPPHVRAPGGGHPHNCTPCSPSLPPQHFAPWEALTDEDTFQATLWHEWGSLPLRALFPRKGTIREENKVTQPYM